MVKFWEHWIIDYSVDSTANRNPHSDDLKSWTAILLSKSNFAILSLLHRPHTPHLYLMTDPEVGSQSYRHYHPQASP